MRFSEHYERYRKERVDRRDITVEACESVKAEPIERQEQVKGRTAYWGYVAYKGAYLKVVVEADGEEITTAHWDRGFKRKVGRQEED